MRAGTMDLSRWISLAVAAVYVIISVHGFLVGDASDSGIGEGILDSIIGLGFWLALCLGCIWWGDELGEGLVGAWYGLISEPSPGWAVKSMGWILLLLPMILVLIDLIRGEPGE
jgi:hypothetical protein